MLTDENVTNSTVIGGLASNLSTTVTNNPPPSSVGHVAPEKVEESKVDPTLVEPETNPMDVTPPDAPVAEAEVDDPKPEVPAEGEGIGDIEMTPEDVPEGGEHKEEGRSNFNKLNCPDIVKRDGFGSEITDIVFDSTYDVVTGANNEHTVNVEQFFETQTDVKHIKMLTEALKNLKEETEYLREQVRECETTISGMPITSKHA